MALIDPVLAGILVCPVDHGELTEDAAASQLVCGACGRRYPVVDGVPHMLEEAAERGEDD